MSSNSTKVPVLKVLVDYDVLQKYKSYQKEIEEINNKKKEHLKIVPESSKVPENKKLIEQIGEGNQSVAKIEGDLNFPSSSSINFNEHSFIDSIVSKVTDKLLENFKSENLNALKKIVDEKSQIGAGSDILPPVANFVEHDISQPSSSDIINIKSTQHNEFDDAKLLKLIPEKFKKRATILLNNIKSNPLQIDFNTKGDLFIDSQSIPNSNIFVIFPELFNCKKKRPIFGLSELATKISTLGWGHLIVKGIAKGLKRPKNYKIHEKTQHSLSEFKNWWYMSV